MGQKKPPTLGNTICYSQELARKSHQHFAVRFVTANSKSHQDSTARKSHQDCYGQTWARKSQRDLSFISALGKHFETKATATFRKFIGAPLRDQSNGNKSYILGLGYHFETKETATKHWGTTSRPKQRQQIAPLRDPSNGNKSYISRPKQRQQIAHLFSYILELCITSKPKQRQQIVHLRIGAPIRDKRNGKKSYISELGHHFEAKATATNRT